MRGHARFKPNIEILTIRDLKRAGFINRGGKGIHRNYEHPKGIRVTISGNLGDDAKLYQEKEVKRGIEEARDD